MQPWQAIHTLRPKLLQLKPCLFLALLFVVNSISAQKLDTIAFNLYTDSLKKGTHNYINVDGKFSDGKWKPLSSKEITFSSTAGVFDGNDLVLPADFKPEWVEITATSKTNTTLNIKTKIWIKKLPDPDRLPTVEEIMRKKADSTKRSKRDKN